MHKTLRSPDHACLLEVLVAARKAAGLTQQKLADRLGQHQSFVAKYENGERRIDLIEFVSLARALERDPEVLLREFLQRMERGA